MFSKNILPNGIEVLLEKMSSVRSTAIGFWIKTGSRNEEVSQYGMSHFQEHMLFKSTTSRSTEKIAKEVDALGAYTNGGTGREFTSLYGKSIDLRFPDLLDILQDMLLHGKLDEEEIVRERGVVLEEIKMTKDSPEEYVHDIFMENFWKENSLSHPILGITETVEKFDKAALNHFRNQWYLPKRIIISIAGNFEEEKILEKLTNSFQSWNPEQICPSDLILPPKESKESFQTRTGEIHIEKDLEQIQFCYGYPGFPRNSPRRFAFMVLNHALGGCMSSRLFLKIREQEGLAYSIASTLYSFYDTGALIIFGGTGPQKYDKLKKTIEEEVAKLKKEGITKQELIEIKENLKGTTVLALEGTTSRMSRLGKSFLYLNEIPTIDDLLKRIDRVTQEEIHEMAKEILNEENCLKVTLGKKSI